MIDHILSSRALWTRNSSNTMAPNAWRARSPPLRRFDDCCCRRGINDRDPR